jgi:hypothetical protein
MAGDVTPAPYQITDNDKRGLIVVTAGCTLAFVWVCFVIRIWLRLQVREWRSDDYFLAAATVSFRLECVAAAWLLIIRTVSGYHSDGTDIPSRQLGLGWPSRRNTVGATRGHREGASVILTRFRLLPSACSRARGAVARPTLHEHV